MAESAEGGKPFLAYRDRIELRDFLAVISGQGLAHGTYVTSSTFTPEAMDFAKVNGIQTQDGEALLKLISHRTQEQQEALLAIARRDETASAS